VDKQQNPTVLSTCRLQIGGGCAFKKATADKGRAGMVVKSSRGVERTSETWLEFDLGDCVKRDGKGSSSDQLEVTIKEKRGIATCKGFSKKGAMMHTRIFNKKHLNRESPK